ncbi:MAG TPA: sigma-70 family RNA polymerase sigma factor [Bryobacteraceae bacterium]|jgi:RNA polymerase sigma-70 factor (ECF subfamily)|nr:sigma-70 family RNA polymerase sigma factor [Bryobacteraceae bacterium]
MAVPLTSEVWTAAFMLEQSPLRHWIEQAKAGDASAFERIMVLHERMVLRTAQRLLMNAEDAKDAAQEVFLKLHKKLGRFREDKDLAPWLYRMTVNVCLDSKRRVRTGVPREQALEPRDGARGPEEAFRAAQERDLLQAALRQLSERERAAIVLRDLEGCSTAQAAAILGSSEGTVRSQISSARVKIRKFIAERLRRRGGGSDD